MFSKIIKKRKMAAVWAVLFALCLALSGCGGSSSSVTELGSSNSDVETQGEDTAAAEVTEVTIEEQVLLEYEGLTITATEYVEDDLWGDEISLLIDNSGSTDFGIGVEALIINDYMISDLFAATVTAGNKANESLSLLSSQLEAAGIENVGQIEIYFYLYDADTYETVYRADPVTIKTSAYDVMDTEADDDGQELYNEGGIRIVGKYVDEDSFWGMAVVLFVENTSDENITVYVDESAINGYMIDAYYSSTVYSGKKAFDDITIFESDLEENGIEAVETIELDFTIYNNDTYETIADVDSITITLQQ